LKLEWLTIADPAVIAASGSSRHPVLRRSEDASGVVEGVVLTVTNEELAAADAYEVDDYVRALATAQLRRYGMGLPSRHRSKPNTDRPREPHAATRTSMVVT
jgi:hypothetical protein